MRFVPVPSNEQSAYTGVYLNYDEDVQWNYTYYNGSRKITGYTIKSKLASLKPLAEEMDKPCDK